MAFIFLYSVSVAVRNVPEAKLWQSEALYSEGHRQNGTKYGEFPVVTLHGNNGWCCELIFKQIGLFENWDDGIVFSLKVIAYTE